MAKETGDLKPLATGPRDLIIFPRGSVTYEGDIELNHSFKSLDDKLIEAKGLCRLHFNENADVFAKVWKPKISQ